MDELTITIEHPPCLRFDFAKAKMSQGDSVDLIGAVR